MKYLPELPTKELLDAIAYGQPIASSHEDIYACIRAAAPELSAPPETDKLKAEIERMKGLAACFALIARRTSR